MTKDEALKKALEALECLIEKTSGRSIRLFMETERQMAISACVGILDALAQHDSVQAKPEPQQKPVDYTGNGTAGREVDVKPTGFFFQMPQQKPVA